jgi:hypothetical protein
VPGRYSLVLGVDDPWSGDFEPAVDTVCEADVGDISDWASTTSFGDPGPSGHLFRTLLQHHTGYACVTDVPDFRTEADPEFAFQLIQTILALGNDPDAGELEGRLFAMLAHVPTVQVLHALARRSVELSRVLPLLLRILARRWRQSDESPIDEAEVEALWRVWPPLGAWCDLNLLSHGFQASEARLAQHLSATNLAALSPVVIGGGLDVSADDSRQRLTISRVIAPPSATPFDLVRLAPGVTLEATVAETKDKTQSTLLVSKDDHRNWSIVDEDGHQSDLLRSGATVHFKYPEPPTNVGQHTDAFLIAIMREGRADRLELIRGHFEAIPASLIGPDAFFDACFAWCEQATRNHTYREQLGDFVAPVVELFSDDLVDSGLPTRGLTAWRLTYELRQRWIRNALGEPLFAVPFVSWAIAMSLIAVGTGGRALLGLDEGKLISLAQRLRELAPKLFDHDLLKVCAIHALDAVLRNRREP